MPRKYIPRGTPVGRPPIYPRDRIDEAIAAIVRTEPPRKPYGDVALAAHVEANHGLRCSPYAARESRKRLGIASAKQRCRRGG